MSHDEQKTYDNGEVTVVWAPGKCMHSGICFAGLSEVFNPKRRQSAPDVDPLPRILGEQGGALACLER